MVCEKRDKESLREIEGPIVYIYIYISTWSRRTLENKEGYAIYQRTNQILDSDRLWLFFIIKFHI